MFEPLQKILHERGNQLQEHFTRIERVLERIATDTRARALHNEWAHKSVTVDSESSSELRNDTGYGWLVHWYYLQDEDLEVHWGAENITRRLVHGTASTVGGVIASWYIPPGTSLVVVNGHVEESKTANFQIELMPVSSGKATLGPSGEHIDVLEVNEQPDANVLNNQEGDDE